MAQIIGPLPVILMDGQIADAVAVMADFNWIVSQVNSNSASSLNFSYVYITQSNGGVGAMTTATNQTQFVTAGSPVTVVDSNTEFTSSNGRFTAKNTGFYRSTAVGQINTSGVTFSGENAVFAIKNGVGATPVTQYATSGAPIFANTVSGMATSDGIVSLNAGDFLNIVFLPRFSGGSPVTGYFSWVIQRVA